PAGRRRHLGRQRRSPVARGGRGRGGGRHDVGRGEPAGGGGPMTVTVPSDLDVTTGFVDNDGERIYYEVTGSGTPLVLCHGLGGNLAIWWRQLDRFAAHHTVVTWDQRGFGNSTCVSGDFGPAPARRDLAA